MTSVQIPVSRSPWAAVAAGLLAVSLVAVLPAPARAQARAPDLSGFVPSDDFVLVVDGKHPQKAEIYRSDRAPAFLILNSGAGQPLLVVPRSGVVQEVSLMSLAKRDDGSIDVLSGAQLTSVSAYQVQGEDVTFTVSGKAMRMTPKPPVLGLHAGDELTSYLNEYARRVKLYKPDPAAVGVLRKEAKPVRVRVFFGSWCPHCREMVPHVLKVEDSLAGSRIHFEYYGLPRPFGQEPEAQKNGINAVPTGIVYVDGKEVGRISGNQWLSPERALVDILGGKPVSSGF